MISDLRFVFRALMRNRGFTLVTVLTLALGIGSAASIFSVTDWILFRANKFPDNLYLIGGRGMETPFNPSRFAFMVQAYREQGEAVLSQMALASFQNGNVVVDGEPVATSRLGVSANIFAMLGVTPALGRTFREGEDAPGADQVVVVSHDFWKRRLGGDEGVIGRQITVDQAICTVVGVLREGQAMPTFLNNQVYQPLVFRVNPEQPWMHSYIVLGQLRPGVSREKATEAITRIPMDVPVPLRKFVEVNRLALAGLSEFDGFKRVEIYWMMLGAVGFLYAIACLNASNLMVVRMLGQRRELCIRLALGGGRWRIIRLLALECGTLALAGSLAGLLVANWLFPLLLNSAGGSMFSQRDWSSWALGWRVIGVMGLLTIITSLLIVLIPAWRVLRTDISAGLKEGGAALGESPALARLRGGLVIMQAAFAVILLAGAGLMIRTFQHLQRVDLGFDPAGLAKVMIGFPPDYPSGREARLARLREIQEELKRVPGVKSVGFGSDLLLPGYFYASHTFQRADGTSVRAGMATFGIGHQETSGLKLKSGRWLTQSMGNEVMVNESLARAMWPGQNPVGQFLKTVEANASAGADFKGWVVTGVVGDLRQSMREGPGNYVYGPERWAALGMNVFVVRFAGEYSEGLASGVRRGLFNFDGRIVVHQIEPYSRVQEHQLWAERMTGSVLKVLAGIALLLTVVGIFSVLAYTVDRRMGEFGVRLALGATRRDLVHLVVRRGVLLTLAGVVLGIGGTLALTRYLKALLFETSVNDPWVLAAVAGLLLGTSVMACVWPARRAARADVSRLLRSE